jgi:hypothetical protein
MSMILEEDIRQVLDDGGFLSAFVDYFGDNQPAPEVQLMLFDESDPDIDGKRIILIRETGGGGGNTYVQNATVSIVLFGLQDKTDSAVVKARAGEIYTYLLETRTKCGIINIDPIVSATPVMLTESGRPHVEIQTLVKIDRGIQ